MIALVRCVAMSVAVLSAMPVLAADHWPDERKIGPLECRADFSLDRFEALLDELTRLDRDLVETLGIGELREPIQLYLFAKKSTYQRYMRRYFPKVPLRRALFIKGRGPGMVFAYVSTDFAVDLRHECTHALLHAHLPMAPLWLDEGLAEYFEVPAEKRAFDNPHLSRVKWNLRVGMAPKKISRLERIGNLREMRQSSYRDAWAWVHFMLHGSPEAHDELVRFLGDIRDYVPPGRLSDRLRRRVPDVDRRLVEHFKGWKR